jgi:hypothetical protein
MFAVARQQWPGATVKASSLDALLEHLSNAVEIGNVQLPLVTGMCMFQVYVVLIACNYTHVSRPAAWMHFWSS